LTFSEKRYKISSVRLVGDKMKRVDLTPEQLDEVIKYRQGGLSWLAIQKVTGISRRVAQRAYEQWEKARSVRELENVRVRVGEIEFGKHIDMLTRWAESLIDHLSLPKYPSFSTDANTYFFSIMEKDIARPSAEAIPKGNEDRSRERNIRLNKLLFESLKAHTADNIRWDSLADWMEGRDTCYRVFPGLKALAGESVRTTFNRFPDLDEWFVAGRKGIKVMPILEEGIRDVLWKGIISGEGDAHGFIRAENVELNKEEVLRITIGVRSLLQRDNREMDPSVADYCLGIMEELRDTNEVKEIKSAVEKMQGVVRELETALEPLVLRPHILWTRCRLCPA